jgi:hypothetical protein
MESLGSRANDSSVDIDEAIKTGMKFIGTCGVIEKCNEASYFISNANSLGVGVYGPYINLSAGQYIVKFDLELYEYKEHYSDQVCAEFDVTVDSGNVRLAHTLIYESRLKVSPSSELFFKLDQPSVVEFRIHFTGRSRLRVSMSPSLRQVDPAKPCYVPMLPESTEITSPFFVNNSGHLRGMFENGASFSLDGEKTIVSFGDVTFQMHTLEDFQVVNEVFIFNDYRYITNNRTICVDIGMNSGLTSLFFANLPNVVEVHSFEPFSTPFKRAQTNFSYNPQLAKKIVANHFGLGDGARRLEVLIDETQTIGTSISGLSAGRGGGG